MGQPFSLVFGADGLGVTPGTAAVPDAPSSRPTRRRSLASSGMGADAEIRTDHDDRDRRAAERFLRAFPPP